MNSDLVYKKKYLKYKNKYTALQRKMNVQEGGVGWSSFKALNPKSSVTLKDTKSGIYLFLVNSKNYYDKLSDPLGLIHGKFLSDTNVEISRALGETCYYVERKVKLTVGTYGRNDIPDVKQCALPATSNTSIKVPFTTDINNIAAVRGIAQTIKTELNSKIIELKQISSEQKSSLQLTHFFIVDFSNGTSSNRISCLYPIVGETTAL
jgi:hypothetical protein